MKTITAVLIIVIAAHVVTPLPPTPPPLEDCETDAGELIPPEPYPAPYPAPNQTSSVDMVSFSAVTSGSIAPVTWMTLLFALCMVVLVVSSKKKPPRS